MSSTLGKNIEIAIFGESHGVAVGVTINGLPSGEIINMEYINECLLRRSTGRDRTMSSRVEADEVIILCGVHNGVTCGTPLTMIINNNDMRSKDYSKMETVARPSHADYTGNLRYKGFNDIRGGGHFSGRLTAAIVMAGALCSSILNDRGINISANILSIGKVTGDSAFNHISDGELEKIKTASFPSISKSAEMIEEINKARLSRDSVGGYIECVVTGVGAGVGSPMFRGIENIIANAVFGVPAVKGIEFGESSELYGSLYNDNMYIDKNNVYTCTNHDGGINGGITNGMPILFTVKMKPTPSISCEQDTIDYTKMQNTTIEVVGRHDPCVVVRAVPVIECMTAIAILDCVMEGKIYE